MAQNDHVTERKTVRMMFANTYNELTKEFEESEPNEIQVRLFINKLGRLSQQMNVLDEQVKQWLFANGKEIEYEGEFTAVESYKDKYHLALIQYESYNKIISAREKEECEGSVCSSASNNKKGNLKLPKIELKKFNGEIKEWLGFWGQFSRIHEDPQIEPEDKFQYLIQVTVKGTGARDIVVGFPATSENYDKVISCLKSRFGRTDMLTEFYIRELLSIIIRNVRSGNEVNSFQLYDQLEAHLRALESIGMTKERYAAILYPMVESCLSEDMIRVWLRSTFSKLDIASDTETYKIKLEQLLAFLKSEVKVKREYI
ncbi:uncharacterized protein [Halyomorpha halys]|uniref:uncharacterized protein n=1 Tax=Halyomorpha halys TaxID=286706 RepID=UPI0006D4E059|nr:uncharacterized protein LOC106684944 [Halyomorpha halys]